MNYVGYVQLTMACPPAKLKADSRRFRRSALFFDYTVAISGNVLPQTSDPLSREAAGVSSTGFAPCRAVRRARHCATTIYATDRLT